MIAVFFQVALLRASSRYLPPPYSFYNGRNGRQRLTLTGGHDEQKKNIGKYYYRYVLRGRCYKSQVLREKRLRDDSKAKDLYGLDDGSGVRRCVHQDHEPSSSPYRSLVRAVSQPFFAQMVAPYWIPYRPNSAVFVEERSMDG